MPMIIAISGISGAGKTTLTRALAERFRSSHLCWDDFDSVSSHPHDYLQWHRNGRDYSAWDYQQLATALDALKRGAAIVHPVTQERLPPTKLVFFDAPLGRLHAQTARWIDLALHVSLPRDIALCRRLIRDYAATDGLSLDDLIDDLSFYADGGHELFDDTEPCPSPARWKGSSARCASWKARAAAEVARPAPLVSSRSSAPLRLRRHRSRRWRRNRGSCRSLPGSPRRGHSW